MAEVDHFHAAALQQPEQRREERGFRFSSKYRTMVRRMTGTGTIVQYSFVYSSTCSLEWYVGSASTLRDRRITLIDASCPSKSDAAVTCSRLKLCRTVFMLRGGCLGASTASAIPDFFLTVQFTFVQNLIRTTRGYARCDF